MSNGPAVCGRLLFSMYGTRDRAELVRSVQRDLDQISVQAWRCKSMFFIAKDGVRLMVRGDDSLAVGKHEGIQRHNSVLESAYKTKSQTTGCDEGEAKEIRIFSRLVRLTVGGSFLEACDS